MADFTYQEVEGLLRQAHDDLEAQKHADYLQEKSKLLISTYREGWLYAATMLMLLEWKYIIPADFPPEFISFFIDHFGMEYPGLSEVMWKKKTQQHPR